jgi:hypothetical protein
MDLSYLFGAIQPQSATWSASNTPSGVFHGNMWMVLMSMVLAHTQKQTPVNFPNMFLSNK